MRAISILFFAATLALSSACSIFDAPNAKLATANNSISSSEHDVASASAPMERAIRGDVHALQSKQIPQSDKNSLAQAETLTQTTERKIIKNADLTIEMDAPESAQRRIASIAERHGGFIVTSETKQSRGSQTTAQTTLTVVARVPAAKFDPVIEEIEKLGGNVIHSKRSGQDVTEEYIDLEARIRTKQALEAQFLEIMKRAGKISDALEVQKELAEVRGEIEQMEGRRRFLENQAALSTITVTLQTPTPIVAATTGGFWQSIKLAFGDSLDTAAEIVLGLIRFVLVMIPVTLLILIPGWYLFRWLWKKFQWSKSSITEGTTVNVTDEVQ